MPGSLVAHHPEEPEVGHAAARDDLVDKAGRAGLTTDAEIVAVGRKRPARPRTDARLSAAGVAEVTDDDLARAHGVLDGGYLHGRSVAGCPFCERGCLRPAVRRCDRV